MQITAMQLTGRGSTAKAEAELAFLALVSKQRWASNILDYDQEGLEVIEKSFFGRCLGPK